jgi:cysteine desulfuration protein SufE
MQLSINEIQDAIIDDFSYLDDWEMRYEYIIELGKSLPIIEDKYKTDEFLIKGCQSRVWLKADYESGILNFKADSDAVITKGIIALLIKVLNQQKTEDIAGAELYFIEKIGLKDHLSPTRSNGLRSMITQMKSIGSHYSEKV